MLNVGEPNRNELLMKIERAQMEAAKEAAYYKVAGAVADCKTEGSANVKLPNVAEMLDQKIATLADGIARLTENMEAIKTMRKSLPTNVLEMEGRVLRDCLHY